VTEGEANNNPFLPSPERGKKGYGLILLAKASAG